MKRKRIYRLLLPISIICVTIFRCANPVDEPPLRWRSNITLPVTNEKFLIGEKFKDLFTFKEKEFEILNVRQRYYAEDPLELKPDTLKGDTVVFSVPKSDTSVFETHEENFGDKEYHVTIGPINITAPIGVNDTIPLPPTSGSFLIPLILPLDKIYEVTFHPTSDPLEITISNPPTSTKINNFVLGIEGLDTVRTDSIPVGESIKFFLPVAGKFLKDNIKLFIGGAIREGNSNSLVISYSFNGLKVSRIKADDHIVSFNLEFKNYYTLTDTIDIDYIDIGNGFFRYKIVNHTGLNLYLKGIHDHMWTTPFTEFRNIRKVTQLKNLSSEDSLRGFLGRITEAQTVANAHSELAFSTLNLSSCRLFPEWNDSLKKSVTIVRYIVSTGTPKGDTITLSSDDSIVFVISTLDFKFKEMQGTLKDSYEKQSDTQKVAINLPWNNSVKDSLRGRFILKKVWGDILLRTIMAERAFLDTLKIDFVAFAPESINVRDSVSTSLVNVSKDSLFLRTLDVTNVTNLYPDTIAVVLKLHIPKGSKVRIVNDLDIHDPHFEDYVGRMIVKVAANYRLNAKLDWEVRAPANMELGSHRYKLFDALRFFRKMNDRKATFEIWLRNNSNLNLSLFAVAATDEMMNTLDSLDMNTLYTMVRTPISPADSWYINLFGDRGIILPGRHPEREYYNKIELDNEELEKILRADSINIRWWVQFNPQERDAMLDTDYVEIKSRFNFSGINNSDSLVIW